MPAILDFPCFVFLEKSLVIVELSLLCSQGHCHTVKIIVVIFLHLFWAQVLRLCHGLGIGSCQNICLSRQLASPNTFIYFNGRRTFPPQMSRMYIVGCQLSQRELQNMQLTISPGISCHIFTPPAGSYLSENTLARSFKAHHSRKIL